MTTKQTPKPATKAATKQTPKPAGASKKTVDVKDLPTMEDALKQDKRPILTQEGWLT